MKWPNVGTPSDNVSAVLPEKTEREANPLPLLRLRSVKP